MPHPHVTMKASDGKNVDEVDIFGTIGEDWWGESTSASTVLAAIRSSEAKSINVNINSGGGSIFEGMAMYDAIRESKAKTTARVIGFAGSMASVVMLAADTVEIVDGAMVMVHNPSNVAVGEAKDLRKAADVLDKLRAGIVRIYAAKTGLEEDEIIAMLDEETWLEATEAKSLGFVDKIVGDEAESAAALASLDLLATAPAAKIPLRFAAVIGGVSLSGMAGKMDATDPGEDAPVANMKQINVELDDDASDEEILAAVREALDVDDADEQDDEDDEADDADEDPADDDGDADDEDEDTEEDDEDTGARATVPDGMVLVDADVLEELKAKAAKAGDPEDFDARDKAIVAKAVSEGRIPAAKSGKYLKALKADFESFNVLLTKDETEGGLAKGLVPVDGERGTSHDEASSEASGSAPVAYDPNLFPQLAKKAASTNPIVETE